MQVLEIDVSGGATASALLGALVELGASLSTIEHAVRSLGGGNVRLTVQDGRHGSTIRVRAPEEAPYLELWGEMRPHVALLPLDHAVVRDTLTLLDRLFAARANVHGVPVEEVDVDPFSGIDDLAAAVALAAAIADVGPCTVRWTGGVGIGSGVASTFEGDVEMPGPVVADLLADVPLAPVPQPLELVDPVGAAALTTLLADGVVAGAGSTAEDVEPAAMGVPPSSSVATGDDAPTGRGRLPGGRTLHAVLSPHSLRGAPQPPTPRRSTSTTPTTSSPPLTNEASA